MKGLFAYGSEGDLLGIVYASAEWRPDGCTKRLNIDRDYVTIIDRSEAEDLWRGPFNCGPGAICGEISDRPLLHATICALVEKGDIAKARKLIIKTWENYKND